MNKLTYKSVLCSIIFYFFSNHSYCNSVNIDISKFTTETNYQDSVKLKTINNQDLIVGQGSVEYSFDIETDNWYELWVRAGNWETNIYIDDQTPIYSNFLPINLDKTLTQDKKILQLFLKSGKHKIKFERIEFPGLPFISSIKLVKSEKLSSKLRLSVNHNYQIFRKNENFYTTLQIAKQGGSNIVDIDIIDNNKQVYQTLKEGIPPGSDNYEKVIKIPTDNEGIYTLRVRIHDETTPAYLIDYAVIDTNSIVQTCNQQTEITKELVYERDLVNNQPEYFSEQPIVSTGRLRYIHSGTTGVYHNRELASYFGINLSIPVTDVSYLLEIDYPDDHSRTFSASIIENIYTPYQIDSGVTSGYFNNLSGDIKTHQIYFYPRVKDSRLLFINWDNKSDIAIQKIRLYKTTIPKCKINKQNDSRYFSTFYEENLRYPAYFGGKDTTWKDLIQVTERWANWSSINGINKWTQAIASYRSKMWPSKILNSYVMSYSDSYSYDQVTLEHDPIPKDIFRLLLLVAEKYGISVSGDLQLAIDDNIEKTFPSYSKDKSSYIIQSSNQSYPPQPGSPYQPYLNPIHQDVTNWVSSIFTELEANYFYLPSFYGLTIRLMPWTFHSWQAFPSVNWGYNQYNINKFNTETNSNNSQSDFNSNSVRNSDNWLSWRVKQITNNIINYKNILGVHTQKIHLDLQLYSPFLSLYDLQIDGGDIDHKEIKVLDTEDWNELIYESGIDIKKLNSIKNVSVENSFFVPAGLRDRLRGKPYDSACRYKVQNDPENLLLFCHKNGKYSTCSQNFINEYLESNFQLSSLKYAKNNQNERVIIAAAADPVGYYILEKFATSLYNGNITNFSYGGLGYVLGQPTYLRNFNYEFLSIPSIPMQKKSDTPEPIAIWHGIYQNKYIFYIINSLRYPVDFTINSKNNILLNRLSNSETYQGNNIALTLEPYQLIAFESNIPATSINILNFHLPADALKIMNDQIEYIRTLIANTGQNNLTLTSKLNELVDHQNNKRYRSAQLTILSPEFIQLYSNTNSYPPLMVSE